MSKNQKSHNCNPNIKPEIFKTLEGKDCSEAFIETKTKLEFKDTTWSGYKHHFYSSTIMLTK